MPEVLAARSLLFVPGHRESMVEKGLALASLDVAILDLEDGVPPAERAAARAVVAATLAKRTTGRPRRFVRVSRVGTPDLEADLELLSHARADGVLLSKVERTDEISHVAARVSSVPLLVSIETARGLLAAPALAAAPRVGGLVFGAEDYARDLGLPATLEAEAREMLYARSAVVVAATASRLPAFDGVWPGVADLEGLRRDALLGRRLGFRGKTLIHPSHVAVANEVFSPDERELAWARRVVEAAERAAQDGRGATLLDGEMIDAPIVARARRMLEQA